MIVLLSNNTGEEFTVFFIKDEPSFVMNGFDLTPLGVQLPTVLVAVSLSVSEPVPGSYSRLAIYQTPTACPPVMRPCFTSNRHRSGGSVSIAIVLDRPVLITEPVIWVGFYLPG